MRMNVNWRQNVNSILEDPLDCGGFARTATDYGLGQAPAASNAENPE